jgi:hypothetical protein
MSLDMVEKITIRLPRDLLTRARRNAAAEGRTLTSLVEEGLRLVTNRKYGKNKSERISLRVSDASGPPFTGIDISNSAALQEKEDLEYIERLKNGFK